MDEDGHGVGADQCGLGLIDHDALQVRVHAPHEEQLGMARSLGEYRLPLRVASRLERFV